MKVEMAMERDEVDMVVVVCGCNIKEHFVGYLGVTMCYIVRGNTELTLC